MSGVNVTACLMNSTVQGYFVKQGTIAANRVAAIWGGPGVMVGSCWPLAVLCLALAIWRIQNHPGIRSGLLLICSVLTVADVINHTWVKGLTPAEFTKNVKIHYVLAIALAQIRLPFCLAAAGWRFAAVYSNYTIRQALIWGLSFVGFSMCIITNTIGITDLNKTMQVSRAYWGLVMVSPLTYTVVGTFVFSYQLKKHEKGIKAASNNKNTLMYLRISNNILMATTLIACLAMIFVSQLLDTKTNFYVIPCSLFLGTVWVTCENLFEVFTIFQKAYSATSSINKATNSQQRSVTGGTGVRQTTVKSNAEASI